MPNSQAHHIPANDLVAERRLYSGWLRDGLWNLKDAILLFIGIDPSKWNAFDKWEGDFIILPGLDLGNPWAKSSDKCLKKAKSNKKSHFRTKNRISPFFLVPKFFLHLNTPQAVVTQ